MQVGIRDVICDLGGLYWDTDRYGLEPFALVLSMLLIGIGIGMMLFRRRLELWSIRAYRRSETHRLLRRLTLALGFRSPGPQRYSGPLVFLYACLLFAAGLGLLLTNLLR